MKVTDRAHNILEHALHTGKNFNNDNISSNRNLQMLQ